MRWRRKLGDLIPESEEATRGGNETTDGQGQRRLHHICEEQPGCKAKFTQTGTTSGASATVTLGDATGVVVGQVVTGTGIQHHTSVQAISSLSLTLTKATTGAITNAVLTFDSNSDDHSTTKGT